MASTYEEIMAKSRQLYAGGDVDGAKRLAEIALSRRTQVQPQTNALEQFGTGANEGLADTIGSPVDLVTGAINAVARPFTQEIRRNTEIPGDPLLSAAMQSIKGDMGETFPIMAPPTSVTSRDVISNPVGGSESLRRGLSPFMTDVPPQTTWQEFMRRAGYETGSSAPIALGIPATNTAMGRAALASLPTYAAAEVGGNLGAAASGQIAHTVAPDNPTAEAVARIAGGFLGGVGAGRVADRRARNRDIKAFLEATPSSEALDKAARGRFEAGHALGIKIKPKASEILKAELERIARDEGLITPTGRISENSNIRDAFALMDDFTKGTISTRQLQGLRRRLNSIAGDPDPSMARVGVMMKKAYDKFLGGFAKEFGEGNALLTRAKRGEMIDKAEKLADVRASQYTQSGHDNALRAEYAALDRQIIKKGPRGLRPDQVEALKRVSRGTKGINRARGIGKFSPTSAIPAIAIGGPTAAAYALGGPVAAIGAGGLMAGTTMAGKSMANALRRSASDFASATMRSATPFTRLKGIDAIRAGSLAAVLKPTRK